MPKKRARLKPGWAFGQQRPTANVRGWRIELVRSDRIPSDLLDRYSFKYAAGKWRAWTENPAIVRAIIATARKLGLHGRAIPLRPAKAPTLKASTENRIPSGHEIDLPEPHNPALAPPRKHYRGELEQGYVDS